MQNGQAQKGFRQAPTPTKGQVLKENQQLAVGLQNQLKNLQTQFQFVGNILNQQALSMRNLNMNMEALEAIAQSTEDFDDPSGAQAGDHLMVDYTGVLLNEDGTPALDEDGDPKYFDGGSAARFVVVDLGSGKLIPGFEDQLVGHKVGETFEIEVTFPENYGVKEMANQKAKFMVHLHKIYRPLAESKVEQIKRLYDEKKRAIAAEKAKKLQEERAAAEAAKAAEQPAAVAEQPTEQTEAPKSE